MIRGYMRKTLLSLGFCAILLVGVLSCDLILGSSNDAREPGVVYEPQLVFFMSDKQSGEVENSLKFCKLSDSGACQGPATLVSDVSDVLTIQWNFQQNAIYFTSLFNSSTSPSGHSSKLQAYCFVTIEGCTAGHHVIFSHPSELTFYSLAVDGYDGNLYWSASDGNIYYCPIWMPTECQQNGDALFQRIGFNAGGMGYDSDSKWLYWSSVVEDVIQGCNANGDQCASDPTTILDRDNPHQMKVSTHSGLIYWITLSSSDISSKIETCSLIQSSCPAVTTLVSRPHQIVDVAVSPFTDDIYWVEVAVEVGAVANSSIYTCEISNCQETTSLVFEVENAYLGSIVVMNGFY